MQIDLLKLLLDHKGMALSRSQILNAVWGDDSYVIDRIVDSYIRNLRKKLELDCIVTAKGIGYKACFSNRLCEEVVCGYFNKQ